jgi:hypothetical protein
MAYLYGDLSPAPFTTNFLEELRDAVDFAAALADADQCIANADARREALRKQADEESVRIDALVNAIGTAIQGAEKGEEGSATITLANEVSKLVGERRSAAEVAVQKRLTALIRELEKETLEARADYFPMLERYLLARIPPTAKETLRVELVGVKKDERHYEAEVLGRSDLGLEWSIEVAVPDDGSWSEPMRVDDALDGLAITAPHLTGLIKKEVKPKRTKIGRHFVTKLVDDGGSVRVEVRDEIGKPDGFDITADLVRKVIMVTKTGEEDDETTGTFDVAAEDQAPLFELTASLRAAARTLPKKKLASATFDKLPFDGENTDAQPKLVQLVTRLSDKLALSIEEVAKRSRSDDELVLRRVLDDGRREELFMPKARIREQLEGLDGEHRDMLFAVDSALDATEITETRTIDVDEMAKVEPPPKEARSEVPPALSPYVRRDSNKQMAAVKVDIPKPKPPVLELSPDSLESKPVLEIQPDSLPVEPRPPMVRVPTRPEIRPISKRTESRQDLKPPPPPEPVKIEEEEAPPSSSRTGELKAMLKTARQLSKDGKHDESFRAYASLFSSAAFQASKPEDQHAVLKMMVHAKLSPSVTSTEDSKAAHKAALPALQALVVSRRDPADYEMLGMAYVILGEEPKAVEIFKKALEIERARSPGSDLCGDLMRRVSQL